jgi:hypothetical protein
MMTGHRSNVMRSSGDARGVSPRASRDGYAGEQCAELGVLTQVETLLNWFDIA